MTKISTLKVVMRIDPLTRPISLPSMDTSLGNPAPWRDQFLRDMTKMAMPICSLATLHPTSLPRPSQSSNTAATGTGFAPRVRTVVFRGTWATLPANEQNPAPLNSPVYESDMPTFTTDARMEKIAELMASPDGVISQTSSPTSDSGGGASVEAVFWVPDTMTQWRVRGVAYIVAPDIETEKGKAVRDTLQRRMRKTDKPAKSPGGSWSWSRELTAHFGNLSPKMRGSFRNPPPGTLRTTNPGDSRLGLGQEVTDLEDEVARGNFRLVVIVPGEVDQVDLKGQRRWVHRYVEPPKQLDGMGTDGEWETCEVWP